MNELQALQLPDNTDEKISVLLHMEGGLFILTNTVLFFAITVHGFQHYVFFFYETKDTCKKVTPPCIINHSSEFSPM